MENSILRNCGITAMSIDITYNCNFRCRHCFNRSGEHCFGEKEFVIEDLYELLLDRKNNLPEKSFTTKLFKDRAFLNSKILEEAQEVTDFENGEDDLGWEAADLTYFVLTLMAQHNVTPQEVLNNLDSRRK